MDVILIGHSFVRRFKDHFCRDTRGTGKDISEPELAESLSQRLSIDHHFKRLYTISQGVIFIRDLYQHVQNIDQFVSNPTVIILDIGSNDLAQLHRSTPDRCLKLASELVDMAETLTLHRLIKLVIIHSVVPRFSRINSTIDNFYKNFVSFNKYVQHLCSITDSVQYHKLRGFFHRNRTSSHSTWWTSDGIHCNARGLDTYKARLRHGLLFNRHSIH